MEREQDIQSAICQWLSYKRIFHYRNNTGAFKTERGGFIRYGTPGSPDIVCCYKGRFIAIEVKSKAGRQSPSQLQFQENLENAGGYYFIARSIKDVEIEYGRDFQNRT